MGQKVNSIIFRQPHGNPQSTLWFSKFNRYSQFLSQDIEIRKFLTFLLERKGIILKSSNLERTSEQIVLNLDLYFSVFLTKKSKALWATKILKKLKTKFKGVKRLKYVKSFIKTFESLNEKKTLPQKRKFLKKNLRKIRKFSPLRKKFMLNILYGEDKLNKKTLPEKIKFHKNNLSKKPKLNKKNLRKKRKFNKKRCRFQLLVSFYSKKQHTKHKLKSFVNYLRRFCKKEKKQIKTLIPPSLVKHKISLIETLSYERRLLFFIIFKQRKKYFFKRKEKISILSVLKKSFTPKLLRVKIVKLKKLLKTGKCIYNFHRFNCLKASGPSKKIKSFPFLKLNKILCVFLQRFVGIEQIKIRFFSTQLKFLPTFKLLRRKVDRRLFFFKRNKSLTPYFKESLEILFLVFSMFSFGNAILLTKLIGRLLEVNRRQIVIVKFFKKVMAIFFRRLPKRVCGLSGMRIMIIGRFNKRPRTKTIILQQGQICLQTISIPIDFHYRQVVTLFGSFGVKVWLSKKIEKEKKMKLYNGGKKRK